MAACFAGRSRTGWCKSLSEKPLSPCTQRERGWEEGAGNLRNLHPPTPTPPPPGAQRAPRSHIGGQAEARGRGLPARRAGLPGLSRAHLSRTRAVGIFVPCIFIKITVDAVILVSVNLGVVAGVIRLGFRLRRGGP